MSHDFYLGRYLDNVQRLHSYSKLMTWRRQTPRFDSSVACLVMQMSQQALCYTCFAIRVYYRTMIYGYMTLITMAV